MHTSQLIEARAHHGFSCDIAGQTHWCFPRLGAMSLDTPERVKYFGLRSARACGLCRLRNGRSVTRRARRHDKDHLNTLFSWAQFNAHTKPQISARSRARKRLLRYGWNYKHMCGLDQYARDCLVPVPRFGNVPLAGLVHSERMHLFFINYCQYAMNNLAACVPASQYATAHKYVLACQQFRDPQTGKTHPRLASVLKMTHLTAERRVRAIFYWAHVLGTKAEVIVRELRSDAKVVVATLQLMLIAVRGHRAYTEKELNFIFNEVGTQFFRSMEKLSVYAERERLRKGREAHARNPSRNRDPAPFKRQKK